MKLSRGKASHRGPGTAKEDAACAVTIDQGSDARACTRNGAHILGQTLWVFAPLDGLHEVAPLTVALFLLLKALEVLESLGIQQRQALEVRLLANLFRRGGE